MHCRMNVKISRSLKWWYKIIEQVKAIGDNIGETNMITVDVIQQNSS